MYPALKERLQHQHRAIHEILNGLNEEQLNFRLLPGKWSIHDNVAHLAKYQPVFMQRIQKIIMEDIPTFERYIAENDPDFDMWQRWDTSTLLKRIDADRTQITDFITLLTLAQSERVGVHRKFGRLNVLQWTEFYLLHEAHHIFTIFQLAHDPLNK